MMTRARLFVVFVAALAAALFIGAPASSQIQPSGYIYRCGGTGFLHVTSDVEDSNCKSVNLASTSDVAGTLPPTKGGTGTSVFPSPGVAGNVLVSNGSGGWLSAAPAAPPPVILYSNVESVLSAAQTAIVSLPSLLRRRAHAAPLHRPNARERSGASLLLGTVTTIPHTYPFEAFPQVWYQCGAWSGQASFHAPTGGCSVNFYYSVDPVFQ